MTEIEFYAYIITLYYNLHFVNHNNNLKKEGDAVEKLEKVLSWAKKSRVFLSKVILALLSMVLCTILLSKVIAWDNRSKETVVINDVVRIFFHEAGRYTIMVQKNNSNHIERYFLKIEGGNDLEKIDFVADVKDDQKMWVKYTKSSMSGIMDMEFHIHSFRNIQGGGWEKTEVKSGGVFSSSRQEKIVGATNVIE